MTRRIQGTTPITLGAAPPRALLALFALLVCMPARAATQEPTRPEAERAATPPPIDVSPRGAFLRALALPGWGHAAIGSYTRGGFYFAVQSATAYTFLRTRHRLNEVRERVDFREDWLRAELAAQGLTDPAAVDAALAEDVDLTELRALREARAQQREDLIAFGIFVLFLSGADAYVSAHLSRFPEPLEVGARVLDDGRYGLVVRVPLPR